MSRRPNQHPPADDPVDLADGFYDPEPADDADLWFLPDPDASFLDEQSSAPLPYADQRPLIDVTLWAQAQATLAPALADLTFLQGILVERLRQGPSGWRHRLALQEAADLSWFAGDRVPAERLALWLTLRLAGDADDTQELVRAGWAVRRLTNGPTPQDDLADFLGRRDQSDRLTNQVADWQEVVTQAKGLHRITQAALGFHLWPVLGLSQGMGGAAPLALIEAAVVAARGTMQDVGDGDLFQPLALGGAMGLRPGGGPEERLKRWIAGCEQATRAALRLLDRLTEWEANAISTCAGQSGRTPPKLITLLRDWPLVSAPMAESEGNASRAAVQRNLNWMTRHGVAREVTGQGRYRFWCANI